MLLACNTSIYTQAFVCSEPHMTFDYYRNECIPASLIQFDDQDNDKAMRLLYGLVFPVLALLVVLTNGVVVCVLGLQSSKRTSVIPLLCMAICSVFMAVAPLPFTVYYYTLAHYKDVVQNEYLCFLHKVCMEVFPFLFNTLVTFFTLLLGAQRFIAVHYPLETFTWCTRKRLHRSSRIIVLVSILLTSTHFLADTRVVYTFCIPATSFWVSRCFIGHSWLARSVGVDVFAWVFDSLRVLLLVGPSAILFMLTLLLIRAIRLSDKTRVSEHRHHGGRRASSQTTVMLVVVIVSSLFPSLSSSLNFLHDRYLVAFTNILFMGVHPISFAVYMFMSRNFRISLRRLLGWKFLATDDEFLSISRHATASMRSLRSRTKILDRTSEPPAVLDSPPRRSERGEKSATGEKPAGRTSEPRRGVVFHPSLVSQTSLPSRPELFLAEEEKTASGRRLPSLAFFSRPLKK